MVFINFDNRFKNGYDYEEALDIVDKMMLEEGATLEEVLHWIDINVPLIFCQDKENLIELAEINEFKQTFITEIKEIL
jgi:hypothetical protein|nr:MAG TPA: hypothetical protein [Caudoviricetes sp.]